MQKITITGNIGSGKSSIAQIFADQQIPIFDADAAIQKIYQSNLEFTQAITAYDHALITNNKVDKAKIIAYLYQNPDFIITLEGMLYPLLAQKREAFIKQCINENHTMSVFEIPLLFEKNLEKNYDFIILLYAPYDIRLERTLRRPDMTQEKFDLMNNKQIPYQNVINQADLVIDTSQPKKICQELVLKQFF